MVTLDRWAASGAMALTGRPDGPPLPPPPALLQLLDRLEACLDVDAYEHVVARAASKPLGRGGTLSCGGATRLLRADDAWFALALPRDDDIAAVPALLEADVDPTDPWQDIEVAARDRAARDVVDRARLLGVAAAVVGEATATPAVTVTRYGTHRRRDLAALTVVDLSALWAGPLCSELLAARGATVISVRDRPDGLARLPALIAGADVVIEASRPRALEQRGITAGAAPENGPAVWVSITGYGRTEPGRNWIAFGDDAAVAGGLVAYDAEGPCFCADAIADPLTGMVAAAATIDAIAGGDAVLLDVAMAGVAAMGASC